MRNWFLLLGVAGVLGVLTCTHAAYGQFFAAGAPPSGPGGPGGPGQPPPPPPPPMTMKTSSGAVFVLQGATLYKYDGSALTQLGAVDLSGQTTTTTTTKKTTLKATNPVQPTPPPAPGAFILNNDSPSVVLAVVGDEFYSIDVASLQILAKGALPAVTAPQTPSATLGVFGDSGPSAGGPGGGSGAGPAGPPPPLPVLELSGTTLYVLRANQLCAVKISDGTVLSQTTVGSQATTKTTTKK